MRQWRNGGNSWLEETVGEVQTQEDLNGLMRLMIKSALQRMLDTELGVLLGRRAGSAEEGLEASSAEGDAKTVQTAGNHRSGYSQKTVKGDMGKLTLDSPRDRNATFDGISTVSLVLLPP